MDRKACKGVPFKMLSLVGMAALLSFPLGNAFATTTVTNFSPAWLLDPATVVAGNPSWGVPRPTPENESSSEPVGDFVLSQPFAPTVPNVIAGANFYILVDDQTLGAFSDIISFANTAPRGLGEIRFYSDPNDILAI